MQASKFVAAGLALVMAGGLAVALTQAGSSTTVSRPICSSNALSFADQTACQDQTKAATSDLEKAQIFARFQSKIDARVSSYGSGPKSGNSAS